MFKVKRMAAALAFVVVASATVVGLSGGPALAGTTRTQLAGAVSALYLEVPRWSTVEGTTLDQWQSNSDTSSHSYTGKNQQWSLPGNNDDGVNGRTGFIRNEYSGMCITTNGSIGYPVFQSPCDGLPHQDWKIDSFHYWDWSILNFRYYFHIVNPQSNLALNVRGGSTDNGADIIGWPLNGKNERDNQSWQVSYAPDDAQH